VAGAAIVSDIDLHCYLRLLAAHRPVFAREMQGDTKFIVVYNSPSLILQANFWRERSRTMVKSHRRIGQAPILDGRERGKHGCLRAISKAWDAMPA
jgi:hypothetical protein